MTGTVSSISHLTGSPADARKSVISFLNERAVRALSVTCRSFRELIQDESVQRMLVALHYPHSTLPPDVPAFLRYRYLTAAHSSPGMLPWRVIARDIQVECEWMLPDATKILTKNTNGTVCLWDLGSDPRVIWSLPGQGAIGDLQITPKGKKAVAVKGATAIVIDLETGKILKSLVGHLQDISCVQISPDTMSVYTGSKDQTVKHWDLDTGECLHTFVSPSHIEEVVKISSDGMTAIGAWTPGIATIYKPWELETGKALPQMEIDYPQMIELVNKSEAIVIESIYLWIWNFKSGKYAKVFCSEIFRSHDFCRFSKVRVTPDLKTAVFVQLNGILHLINFQYSWLKGSSSAVHFSLEGKPITLVEIRDDGTGAICGLNDGRIACLDFSLTPGQRLGLPEQLVVSQFTSLPKRVQHAIMQCAGIPAAMIAEVLYKILDFSVVYQKFPGILSVINVYNAKNVALPELKIYLQRALKRREQAPFYLNYIRDRIERLPLCIQKALDRNQRNIRREKGIAPEAVLECLEQIEEWLEVVDLAIEQYEIIWAQDLAAARHKQKKNCHIS